MNDWKLTEKKCTDQQQWQSATGEEKSLIFLMLCPWYALTFQTGTEYSTQKASAPRNIDYV